MGNVFFPAFPQKKCEMAVRQRCRFAVPGGHTPLFASTSLCSFGSQKKCEVQP